MFEGLKKRIKRWRAKRRVAKELKPLGFPEPMTDDDKRLLAEWIESQPGPCIKGKGHLCKKGKYPYCKGCKMFVVIHSER